MPETQPPSKLHLEISAQATELQQLISRDVNTLADFKIARQGLGWFGWIAGVYFFRSVRRLQQRIEQHNGLLAFNREVRDLLDLVERDTP